jgi:hypothetical protein
VVAVAVALGVLLVASAAWADTGVQGPSYTGTGGTASAPTGEKPQSKLWVHDGLWWGVLFNATSGDYEIYKYDKNAWSWTSTNVVVDPRSTSRVDALSDGATLHTVGAVRTSSVSDNNVYVKTFNYNSVLKIFEIDSSVVIHTGALEEVVLAKDSTGVLWANWTDNGTVWVTHSSGGSWVAPYLLVSGLVPGNPDGDSSSIVAFDGHVGVMWSNQVVGACDPLAIPPVILTCEGFHFAYHANGAGDDPALDWTFELALGSSVANPKPADDHMNLKAVGGTVYAAVKHSNVASGSLPEISVLRRNGANDWTQKIVWQHSSNGTRPILEIDTSASRAYLFMSQPCCSGGTIYRKDAALGTLDFGTGSGLGTPFIALSTDLSFNNPTSTKQNLGSSTGLLVMAGDDVTDRYGFNYLTLGGSPVVPSWPTGVSGVPANTATGGGAVAVSWSPPGNDGGSAVTQYEVTPYLAGVPQLLLVKTFTLAQLTQTNGVWTGAVPGLVNGLAYTFTVRAKNGVAAGFGPASAASLPVTPYTVPGAPTAVVAEPGDRSASVTWVPPLSNGGSPITGYSVVSSPGNVTVNVGAAVTNATVSGLTNGTTYTFTVKAINIAGASAGATSNAIVPRTLPGAPTNVSAVPGDASATVSWIAPSNTGGLPLIGYVVTPLLNGVLQSPLSLLSTATTQTVTGLVNGATYTFTVKATTLSGNGPASATSNAVTPRTVPGAPTGVTAAGGDGSATVSWTAPASDGGAAITGYTVTPIANGAAQSPRTFSSTATTQTITGLANLSSYTFTVAATNVAGTGPASAASGAVTPHGPGYWMLGADGAVYAFGGAQDVGEPLGLLGANPAVDLEPTASGTGYWIVDDLGRVYGYNAPWFGNLDASKLRRDEKVTSLSPTPAGDGYWIFTSRGRVFQFGAAKWFDDLHDVTLNGPVLDSIATPSGKGYYMVASDGGVFTFGDAVFLGSMGATRLNAPVQSLVPDPDGTGYWLVASDGGVFTFQTEFRGSMGNVRLNKPVTGMVPYGNGYLMVGEDGGIFNFSNLAFSGSLGNNPPLRPIVSVAVLD